MDGQEYLNQISADNRPIKKPRSGILASKFFWVLAIGVVAFILIVIMGAILGGGRAGEKDLSFALKFHLDNTLELIDEYQPSVKSSDLRSGSASLYGVLSDTNKKLTEFITEKYNYKEKDVNKKIINAARTNRDELENELYKAKINGILDRVYAHKMAYEISLVMSEESKIYDGTSQEELKKILDDSYNSLKNLYDKFDKFSETN